MKIRMKSQITGTRDGERWPPVGKTIVVPDAEGALLCAQGNAEPVAETAPERATVRKPETRRKA